MENNKLTLLERCFPLVPLFIGLLFIQYDRLFAEPDAQSAIAYMFVLILSCQGMLAFTLFGWSNFAEKRKTTSYYKVLFITLAILNLGPLVLLIFFGIWGLVLLSLTLLLLGILQIKREKTWQSLGY